MEPEGLLPLSQVPPPVSSLSQLDPVPAEPCAMGSTQPLKMSTRDFSWGKGGRCVRLTTYHPCSAEYQVFRGLNLPGHLGPSRRPVVSDLYLLYFSQTSNQSLLSLFTSFLDMCLLSLNKQWPQCLFA
jgi:hypothetical protein